MVKILNGIRRSGKSSVLALLEKVLLDLGKSPDQMISINFESMQYSDIRTSQDLYKLILSKIHPIKTT